MYRLATVSVCRGYSLHNKGAIRELKRSTHFCISPAAVPIDRHNSTIIPTTPTASRTLGFRIIYQSFRVGGSRALAAFHDDPFSPNILKRGAPAVLFTSSGRTCDNRSELLLSLIPRVWLLSRCVWTGWDCGVATLTSGVVVLVNTFGAPPFVIEGGICDASAEASTTAHGNRRLGTKV